MLLAVYPKMRRAGSSVPQDFLLHVQKSACIDVCRMNLFCSGVSNLLRFAGLFILPASVEGRCFIYHQRGGFAVICCCVTFNKCKIKM